jgi:hypothetical protein
MVIFRRGSSDSYQARLNLPELPSGQEASHRADLVPRRGRALSKIPVLFW